MKKLIAAAAVITTFAAPSFAAINQSGFAALQQQVSATCSTKPVYCPGVLAAGANQIMQGGGAQTLSDAQINSLLIQVLNALAGSPVDASTRTEVANVAAGVARMISDGAARESAQYIAGAIGKSDRIDSRIVAQTGSSN